jgi:hypothetical protein
VSEKIDGRDQIIEKLSGDNEWLQVLLALVLLALLTGTYFILPENGNTVAAFLKAILPNLITALLAFTVIFIFIRRRGLGTQERLILAIKQELRGSSESVISFDDDIGGASELIEELIQSQLRKDPRSVVQLNIVSFTGATFMASVLRNLISTYQESLSVEIRLMDFNRLDPSRFPSHWPSEAQQVLIHLPELCGDKTSLKMWTYDHFPVLLGFRVGQDDLLLAVPAFDSKSGKVLDKILEYRYFRRNPSKQYIFDLYTLVSDSPIDQMVFPHS